MANLLSGKTEKWRAKEPNYSPIRRRVHKRLTLPWISHCFTVHFLNLFPRHYAKWTSMQRGLNPSEVILLLSVLRTTEDDIWGIFYPSISWRYTIIRIPASIGTKRHWRRDTGTKGHFLFIALICCNPFVYYQCVYICESICRVISV